MSEAVLWQGKVPRVSDEDDRPHVCLVEMDGDEPMVDVFQEDGRWNASDAEARRIAAHLARELHKLQAAAVEYRAAIDRLERAHVRFETSYVELRQPAREALFEETRKAALAEANLAALLPPPADAEEPAP